MEPYKKSNIKSLFKYPKGMAFKFPHRPSPNPSPNPYLAQPTIPAQRPLAPDACPCCKLPRTTLEVDKWKCTFPELEAAAKEDCKRCDFYLQCLRAYVLVDEREIMQITATQGSCEYGGNGTGGRSGYIEIFGLPGETYTAYRGIKERGSLPGNTSSDTSFQTIKGWIEDCAANHPKCNELPEGPNEFQSPTRLLELINDRVRLVEKLTSKPRYACLSHCWGPPNEVLKTTHKDSTIEKFRNEIPWHRLTKTFQDAIDTCRRVGIHYIWIDSLCIIQDSDEDWHEESAKMADIYENAFLTIAATRSNRSSMGCFATTEPQHLSYHVPQHNVYVRTRPPEFPTHWLDKDKSDIWPIFSRGWCYQELRLGRRTLHFCPQEVIWECRSARKSESTHSDEDFINTTRKLYNTMYNAVPYLTLAEHPIKLWWRTVQEYSRLSFSFEKDKLAALGALAQRMEKLRGGQDRYLAGLWESSLLLDLMWKVWPAPKRGSVRPEVWRAPIWSWASVNGQVIWESALDETLASVKVVNIRYDPVGPTHLGEVSIARITLFAPLLKTTVSKLHRNMEALDESLEAVLYDRKMDYDISAPGPDQVPSTEEIYILPVGVCRLNSHHEGLVLRRRLIDGDVFYERIAQAVLEQRDMHEIKQRRYDRIRERRSDDWDEMQEENRQIDRYMERLSGILQALPHVEVTLL